MEEDRNIKLPLGKVALDNDLGPYYIDMRPAIIHYVNNIYGGKFDEDGVPLIDTKIGLVYSPINIAQYGFMVHSRYSETKNEADLRILKNCLAVLEKTKTKDDDKSIWYHEYPNAKYDLPLPWASAMAQGEVISFYLRMYQILDDDSLLQTAKEAYNYLKVWKSEGGVRVLDDEKNLWLEEYPTEKPLLVLNGFIYAIFGLFDLFRVTGSEEVKKEIDACILTLRNSLNKFDTGFWSLYDLGEGELVRYYYQKNVHVPQLQILYQLTGESIFDKYQKRWSSQLTKRNFLFVQVLYRVRYRMPWLYEQIIRLWRN